MLTDRENAYKRAALAHTIYGWFLIIIAPIIGLFFFGFTAFAGLFMQVANTVMFKDGLINSSVMLVASIFLQGFYHFWTANRLKINAPHALWMSLAGLIWIAVTYSGTIDLIFGGWLAIVWLIYFRKTKLVQVPTWKVTAGIALIAVLASGVYLYQSYTEKKTRELLSVVYNGSERALESALREGVDPNVDTGIFGNTVLFFARTPEQISLLLHYGADVTAVNDLGRTALFSVKSVEAARILVEHGAKLDIRDATGETPLMSAVRNGDPNIVAYLLQQGANPEVTNEKHERLLSIAWEKRRDAKIANQQEQWEQSDKIAKMIEARVCHDEQCI